MRDLTTRLFPNVSELVSTCRSRAAKGVGARATRFEISTRLYDTYRQSSTPRGLSNGEVEAQIEGELWGWFRTQIQSWFRAHVPVPVRRQICESIKKRFERLGSPAHQPEDRRLEDKEDKEDYEDKANRGAQPDGDGWPGQWRRPKNQEAGQEQEQEQEEDRSAEEKDWGSGAETDGEAEEDKEGKDCKEAHSPQVRGPPGENVANCQKAEQKETVQRSNQASRRKEGLPRSKSAPEEPGRVDEWFPEYFRKSFREAGREAVRKGVQEEIGPEVEAGCEEGRPERLEAVRDSGGEKKDAAGH